VTREELIKALIPDPVRQGDAYQVPDATGMVKLDAMENPYTWPQFFRDKLAQRLVDCTLNRYPDPHAEAVRAPLRQWMQIPETLDLLFGNGSDEIIALLISNLIDTGRSVCAPDPSFVMFQVLAKQYRVPFRALPLDSDFDIDIDGWMDGLMEADPALIFVPHSGESCQSGVVPTLWKWREVASASVPQMTAARISPRKIAEPSSNTSRCGSSPPARE
jgi:histidinol-phosphate aminotransferase